MFYLLFHWHFGSEGQFFQFWQKEKFLVSRLHLERSESILGRRLSPPFRIHLQAVLSLLTWSAPISCFTGLWFHITFEFTIYGGFDVCLRLVLCSLRYPYSWFYLASKDSPLSWLVPEHWLPVSYSPETSGIILRPYWQGYVAVLCPQCCFLV